MSSRPHSYRPIPTDGEDGKLHHHLSTKRKHNSSWWWFLLTTCMISIGFNTYIVGLWAQCRGHGCSLFPQLTNTPAASALEYTTRIFERGLVDQASIYEQDPSPQVDDAWIKLYEFSSSTLPRKNKVPTFNETLEFVKQKGNRIRMLDVFHQLHCLDTVRRALYPNHYRHPADPEHVMHCVNSVRQSLMCMADISVVSWEWDYELNALIESTDNLHTCRDFSRIKQWALDNHFDRQFVGTP